MEDGSLGWVEWRMERVMEDGVWLVWLDRLEDGVWLVGLDIVLAGWVGQSGGRSLDDWDGQSGGWSLAGWVELSSHGVRVVNNEENTQVWIVATRQLCREYF